MKTALLQGMLQLWNNYGLSNNIDYKKKLF